MSSCESSPATGGSPTAPPNLSARQPPSQCDTTLDHIEFALGNDDAPCCFSAETGAVGLRVRRVLETAPLDDERSRVGCDGCAGRY